MIPVTLVTPSAASVTLLTGDIEPMTRFRNAGIHDTVVFFGSARLTADGPLGRYYDQPLRMIRMRTALHW